jgi:hypothetical protein
MARLREDFLAPVLRAAARRVRFLVDVFFRVEAFFVFFAAMRMLSTRLG